MISSIRFIKREKTGEAILPRTVHISTPKSFTITKGQIEKYIINYLQRCTFPDLENGISSEMKMLKNISARYYNDNDKISEIDKDLLVNLLKVNVDERDNRNDVFLHDLILEGIIEDLNLTSITENSKYFNLRSYL